MFPTKLLAAITTDASAKVALLEISKKYDLRSTLLQHILTQDGLSVDLSNVQYEDIAFFRWTRGSSKPTRYRHIRPLSLAYSYITFQVHCAGYGRPFASVWAPF